MKISATAPDIYIDAQAMAKLRAWTHHAEGEVSGLGIVEASREDGRIESLEISEVMILEQECSGTTTELRPEAVAQLLIQLESEGRSDQLRLWWHSHADMGVFWSPTDEANIRRLSTADFALSVVVNKSWDVLARVDWFSPARVTLDELPLHLLLPEHEVSAQCRHDIEQLVHPAMMKLTVRKPAILNRFQRPRVDDVMADPFGHWDELSHRNFPFLTEDDE